LDATKEKTAGVTPAAGTNRRAPRSVRGRDRIVRQILTHRDVVDDQLAGAGRLPQIDPDHRGVRRWGEFERLPRQGGLVHDERWRFLARQAVAGGVAVDDPDAPRTAGDGDVSPGLKPVRPTGNNRELLIDVTA